MRARDNKRIKLLNGGISFGWGKNGFDARTKDWEA